MDMQQRRLQSYQNHPARCSHRYCNTCGKKLTDQWIENQKAILPDTEDGLEKMLEVNTKFSAEWPNITVSRAAPDDADAFKGEDDKYDKYFSPEPGEGD